MKKVFSVKKFIEDTKLEFGDKILIDALKLWALDCEGLTPEEMGQKGFGTAKEWLDEAWLVEVED